MDRIRMLLGALAMLAAGATTLQAQKAPRPTPTLVGTPGAAAPATTATPATTQPAPASTAKRPRPTPTLGGAPAAGAAGAATGAAPAVVPQAAHIAPAAAANTFTAGLSIEPYSEEGGEEPGAYARRFALQLDSAIATLVGVFRNTSGQPVAGAAAPNALSQRERDRWNRCRDLHWDLESYVTAAHDLPAAFGETPAAARAAAALDTALAAEQATAECDNVASMIAAPDRWTPWGEQYQTTARRFYTAWYTQIRDVQEHNRAFIIALNTAGAAGARIPVPPAMPRTPPYAGAGVR